MFLKKKRLCIKRLDRGARTLVCEHKGRKQPFWIKQGSLLLGVLAAQSALLQEQAHGSTYQQSKKVIDHYNSTFHRGIEVKGKGQRSAAR